MASVYYYTRYFPDIESVARYALRELARPEADSLLRDDRTLRAAGLSEARHFQLCQAVRSYYGSTEFLEAEQAAVLGGQRG